MELTNALYKYDNEVNNKNAGFMSKVVKDLIRLIAPFAPHFAEEMWENMGCKYSVFNETWPRI